MAASVPPSWRRRLRNLALAAAAFIALVALLGFVGVPWIAKRQVQSFALTDLGRVATIGEIRFNPFTLRARISDFALSDREPADGLLRFEALDLDFGADSLWKLAPVIEAARLTRPRVRIALDAQGRSNVHDLLARSGESHGDGKPLPFALHNLEVEDGTLVFEDAARRHRTEIAKLAIGLPFLSGRAGDAMIRVQPHLSGVIDGAPFALQGTTSSPFQDLQRATLALDFNRLPLPKYAEYAPLPNGLRLTGGALTTRLALIFTTWKGKPRGIVVSGSMGLDDLAIARRDGSPLASLKHAETRLRQVDLMTRTVDVDRIAVASPWVDLRRLEDGALELPRLVAPAAGPGASGAKAQADAAPWSWIVHEAALADGAVQFADRAVTPAFATRIAHVTMTAANLASRGEPGTVEVAFEAQEGARFEARGRADVAARAAQGHFALRALPIAALRPYYTNALAMDVRAGSVDVAADFEATFASPARFVLRAGALESTGLDAALRGERAALVRMARARAEGITADFSARHVAIDAVHASGGALRLVREADGRMNLERVVLPAKTAPSQRAGDTKAADEARWRVVVRRLEAEGLAAEVEDRTVLPPVKLGIANARLAADDLDTRPGVTSSVDFAARVGSRGRIAVKGRARAQPLAADVALEASAIDLLAFAPYAQARTNVVVVSGTLDARGRLAYAGGGGTASVRYAGSLSVNGFDSLDRPTSQPLVRWKTLAVTGIDLATEPLKLAAGMVAIDHFFARIILDADARLNVLQLVKTPPGESAAAAAPAPQPAAQAKEAAPAREIPASIGGVQLTHGEVEFSDYFIQPNYSVHLTDVDGRLSRLAPRQPGTVEVAARVDGGAPVDIRGTVNPFSQRLALDLTAKATGADLPPLTPYAVKYAGYGIEKGKLSMEVHYRIEDRKLSATNKLTLDQLTFGQRIDSPTATKLPVLLLVSLLKDRDGVIRLDLPIAGTLDDPQFSIWRIVVQIIGNLLTKAATAPFALLGALVGGGEQLAYVEFPPGLAVITPASETKLAALSKALAERPQLALDIAGRAVPDADAAGLRRAALDRALKLAKRKDLAAKGESAPPLEEVALEPGDAARYMKTVYGDTKLPNKPRNFIGFAKDIPVEQMEKLLLAGYAVNDDALRELANLRARAVKDWLAAKGDLSDQRMFIVASRIGREGLAGEGAPTRVDFAIRTR